jgi:ATP-binding cassette, subfamily B, bacterial MsbA
MSRLSQSLFADRYGAPAIIRRLLTEHAFAQRRLYAIAAVLMMFAGICTALCAYLLGDVVNASYVSRNLTAIIGLGLLIAGIVTVRGFAIYGQAVLLSRIGFRIVAENQRRMFDKLLSENLEFYADRHTSEFIARLTTGATAAARIVDLMVTAVARDLFTLVALLTVMIIKDPILSVVSLVIAVPAVVVLRKMIRRVRAIARSQFTGGTQIIETMQEALQGIRVVKAFTLENEMSARLDKSVVSVERYSNKLARVANRSGPLMETLAGIAIALAVVYGGYRIIEYGATPGEFLSFVAAFLLAYDPAKKLARLNMDLNSNLVGVRVLFEILDSPATEPPDDGRPPLTLTTARVEFADVQFSYRPGEPVLRGMSFMADPGKVTALIGPSGGGKSTVLNLMLRFYDADSGIVAIDGQDLTTVSRRSVRRQIAYVGQHVHLFRGSIRENIAFGKLGASDDDIVAAAKAAHAHDFIMAFPAGYETPVGEHGMQLSGGQRQRVAIARALIKNAPIILLDEATAALDSESEHHVQAAFAELCKGRTTIVIAHRLSTIMHADRILVIEAGVVVESGRHDELLRKGGRYTAFYRLQLKEQHEPREAIAAVASSG